MCAVRSSGTTHMKLNLGFRVLEKGRQGYYHKENEYGVMSGGTVLKLRFWNRS